MRKESICDCGKNNRTHETSLFDVLESLKPAEQRAAFNFLTRKLLRDAEVE